MLDALRPALNRGRVSVLPQERLVPFFAGLKINLSNLSKIIHVVGTNGKGSTLHYIKALMALRGLICHRFTSPHLHHYTERIEVSGQEIALAKFNFYLKRVIDSGDLSNLSLFDVLTLVMLQAFSAEEADYCLIEAGLGGRLDSTNLDYPLPVTRLITAMSMDHSDILGSNLDDIIKEKRAVIRPQDTVYEIGAIDARIVSFELPDVQKQNLSLALKVVESECDTRFEKDEIEKTAPQIWQGRYQDITDAFCQKFQLKNSGNRFYVDGAHNVEGIKSLMKHFGYENVSYVIKPNKNKADWEAVLSEIPAENLILVEQGIDEKVNFIQKSKNQNFIFCGSLYWVADILKLIR